MKLVIENKCFIFRFADVEVREREFSLLKGGKVLAVEPKAFQRWSIVQLTRGSGWPTWSSDSQFIYFLQTLDDPGVFRVRVSGGNAERVVDLKGFRYTGAFTGWMGLDPTDTPMLIRDIGTDDIYALKLEQK
jgi:hypothetical protein